MFQTESKFWNWLVVSSADPTKVATTIKGALGVLVSLSAFTVYGPHFANLPEDVYTIVVDLFGLISAGITVAGLIRKTIITLVTPSTTQ